MREIDATVVLSQRGVPRIFVEKSGGCDRLIEG
jgi:hypothetical protein